jgi:DNA polymerase-3 subunit chi
MPEIFFYHLDRQPLERVLPVIVAKTLERGWRAVLQATSPERLEALDLLLWTFSEESFIAHGTARDGHPELQAVFLTLDEDNPNGAQARILVDGAEIADLAGYERVMCLFDGHDEAALAKAREQWQVARAKGTAVSYFQQDANGGWQRRA